MTTYVPLPFSQIKYLADNESRGLKELSEETGLSEERILYEIEKLKQQRYMEAAQQKETVVRPEPEPGTTTPESPLLKAIPRKRGVTVMTGPASQMSDELVGSKKPRNVPSEDITTVRK